MKTTLVQIKVNGTVERVLTGHVPDPKEYYERFRARPRACRPPKVMCRKQMLGRENTAFGRPFTFDDPLWNIVGMFDSGADGLTDVASTKYRYLADADSISAKG